MFELHYSVVLSKLNDDDDDDDHLDLFVYGNCTRKNISRMVQNYAYYFVY